MHDHLERHWSLGSFVLGGTVGAAVTLGAVVLGAVVLGAVVLGGTVFDGGDGSRVEFRAEAASAATASAPTGPSAGDDSTDEGSTDESTTTQVSPGTTTASIDREHWDRMPDPTGSIVAITQLGGRDIIATGIVIDGMLVTSASALGGAERVLVYSAGLPVEVLVRGHDPFADLAVLVPLDGSDDLGLGHGFVTSTETPGNKAVVKLVASDGRPEPIVVAGHVLALGQRATTRSGRTVMGAMLTSARVPELGAGAALLDEHNQVIGMVIDVEDYLAVALPVDRIRQIGAEILLTGWPNAAWVGIEGHTSEDGILVTDLDAEGPASDCGLAQGDLIMMVDDEAVTHMAELVDVVRDAGPGTTVRLKVRTDENEWTAYLVVGRREDVATIPTGEAESD
ncbi:MAG: S1C family serine protease [Actinomycetota bacterium]|nr:S1C family serine protease [Actinomycetota bacterium]